MCRIKQRNFNKPAIETLESRRHLTTYSIQTSVDSANATKIVEIDYSADHQTAVISFEINTTFAASQNDSDDHISGVSVDLNLAGGTVDPGTISSGGLTANGSGTNFSGYGNLSPSTYDITETVSWSNNNRGLKAITANSTINLANRPNKYSNATQSVTIPAGSLSLGFDDVPVGGGSDLTPLTLHASGNGGRYQLAFLDSGDAQAIKVWAKPDKSASDASDHIVNADAPIYRIGNNNTTFDASVDTTVYVEGIDVQTQNQIVLRWKAAPTTAPYNPSAKVSFATFRVPDPTSITATEQGSGATQTSDSTSLTITNANSIAVTLGSPALTFTADGTSPLNDTSRSHIFWTIKQNADDRSQVTPPALTSTNGLSTGLSPTASGSFSVIAYYDKNRNNQFDDGEQQRVFHLAIVNVMIKSYLAKPPSTSFSGVFQQTNNRAVFDSETDPQVHAFDVTYLVQVVGGGADGQIGVNKVVVNTIQNVLSDSETMHYTGGGMGRFIPFVPYPVLDENAMAAALGTPFGGLVSDKGPDASGGERFSVTYADSPTVAVDQTHTFPPLSAPSQAELLDGAITYANRLCANSSDFATTYTSYEEVDWSSAISFKWTGTTWQDNGSSNSISAVLDTPNGASAGKTDGATMNTLATEVYS